MPDFAPALKDLGKSGIGVAAAPTGGMGFALDGNSFIPATVKYAGQVLAYNESTSNSSITATTEATANTVQNASTLEFDGEPILIEFFTPRATRGTTRVTLFLYEDSTSLGVLGSTLSTEDAMHVCRRLTPTGLHVYSIRASVDAGTGTINAGAGGVGNFVPQFIRISRT